MKTLCTTNQLERLVGIKLGDHKAGEMDRRFSIKPAMRLLGEDLKTTHLLWDFEDIQRAARIVAERKKLDEEEANSRNDLSTATRETLVEMFDEFLKERGLA